MPCATVRVTPKQWDREGPSAVARVDLEMYIINNQVILSILGMNSPYWE